jgi:Ykl077w/Psg1 (Pma1 Stabilization in Golgi)
LFGANDSIQVLIDYVNQTVAGQQAFESSRTDNVLGFVSITMNKDWLQGASWNNLTLRLIAATTDGESAKFLSGPLVQLGKKPGEHLPAYSTPTKAPSKLGLIIGLPVAFVIVGLLTFGLWWSVRKQRHIGIGNVMSRSRHGYGSRKSRRQRLGGKKGGIRLGDEDIFNANVEGGFKDEVEMQGRMKNTKGGQRRDFDEDLGDLVDTPHNERFGDDRDDGNAFRREIQRQQKQ